MTDTLEIRPHFPANDGRIEYGVFHLGQAAFIASYEDELAAYRYACGYLNTTIDMMTEAYEHEREMRYGR